MPKVSLLKNPTALDGLRRWSFSGIEFPVEHATLRSTGRSHLHEYPHSPGAAPEKLGRGVWYVNLQASFQTVFPGYANLYPAAMNSLRGMYEQQLTATLVHPTAGEFQAFISSWKQDWNPKLRSGEKVEIEFLEDQRQAFLVQNAPAINSTAITQSQADLDNALALVRDQIKPTPQDLSVFDAIRAISNSISAVNDTASMYSGFLKAKAGELSNACARADSALCLQTAIGISMLDALHNLWAAAVQITQNVQSQTSRKGTWTTPRRMTLNDVAIRLYGDTSRSTELYNLNSDLVPDPTSVAPNVKLQYLLPPQQV